MILENTFTVPTDIDQAWALLLDPERVAPCMPGATLDSFDGDDLVGRIRVKVGAIQMTYKLKGRFLEKDEEKRRVVIEGAGKENRGAGTVNATVTLTLTQTGTSTEAHVATELAITGRPAQFGRGALEDIGTKIVGQFAKNLAAGLDSTSPPALDETATSENQDTPATVRPAVAPANSSVENEPLDLVQVLAPSREHIIVCAVALLALSAGFLFGRLSKRR